MPKPFGQRSGRSRESRGKFFRRRARKAASVNRSSVTQPQQQSGVGQSYTHTKKVGFGTKVGNSFKGIVFGFVLFLASFAVLYWNEGGVDISEVAGKAVEISATENTGEGNGRLVSVTGRVVSEESLGDDLYLLSGDYLAVERKVEMFAWVEKSSTSVDKNYGGSETQETTYTYVTDWVTTPADTSSFVHQEDRYNPPKDIEDFRDTVAKAKLGVYDLEMASIGLPGLTTLSLNEKNVNLGPEAQLSGGYVYLGESLQAPEVGDLRISYKVLNDDFNATVFGQQDGDSIGPFVDEDGNRLYNMNFGGREGAVASMHSGYKTMLWVFRIVGFLMMWTGLQMLLAPITVMFELLPFLIGLGQGLTKLVTFIIAFVLSLVTILISMILHNIFALILSVLVIGGIVYFILNKKPKSKPI